MIKALIFDFDGLIVDTETPAFTAWQEIFQSAGCELDLSNWIACIGSSYEAYDPFVDLETLSDRPVDRRKILKQQRQRSIALVEAEDALPGVRSIIAQAKKKGLRLAIASSSNREWVITNLTRLGLLEAFDCLRTMEDVENVKPDPALFRSAIECLGCSPAEGIVFEDSLNGLLAANRAGIACVAIPNRLMRNLDYSGADVIANSMADFSLDDLIDLVETKQSKSFAKTSFSKVASSRDMMGGSLADQSGNL